MLGKLILSAAAIALLGGCMSTGYGYRQDRGDYYYGQQRADYGYYGSPYGYPSYGYPSYGYGSPAYSGHLRFGYGIGGFGYPYQPYPRYYTYPYRPPVIVAPRPGVDHKPRQDRRRPPWRDLDNRGRHHGEGAPPQSQPLPMVQTQVPDRPRVRPQVEGGSRNEQLMRRARDARSEPREIE